MATPTIDRMEATKRRSEINARIIASINYILNTQKGMQKGDMASLMGVTASRLSEILHRKCQPQSDNMNVLVLKFGVSADWLVTGRGTMFGSDSSSHKSIEDELRSVIADKDEYIRQLRDDVSSYREQLGRAWGLIDSMKMK